MVDSWGGGGRMAAEHVRVFTGFDCGQRVEELALGRRHERDPFGHRLTARLQRVRDVGEGRRRRFVGVRLDEPLELRDLRHEAGGLLGRQHDDLRRLPPAHRCREGRHVFLETTCAFAPPKPNELMPARLGIGGASAADGASTAGSRSRCRTGCSQIDVRIDVVHCRGRRQRSVPHRQQHLDDARDAGGRFEVADVALHRADAAVRRARRVDGWRAAAPRTPSSGR